MTAYFIRRFFLIIPTFIGITLLVFAVTRIVPGGPLERMIAEYQMAATESGGSQSRGGEVLSETQLQELREYYGFDKPILVSYLEWLKKIVVLDFGLSTRYQDPVIDTIIDRLPISLFYGLMTTFLTYLISIPLGIIKGVRHHSHFDTLSSLFVFVGYAIPSYIFGIFLIFIFASNLEWFPMGGFVSEGFDDLSFSEKMFDMLHHGALPLVSYLIGSFAVMTMLMKNSLMDNIAADYVRTAVAKGLPYKKTILRHALRNSLIPLATHFGNNISLILTGSFLIEKIFNISGIGLLGFEAIVERDYPVVLGILVISSLLLLVGNILSDVCVALVDPRVQFE
ncbi:MAG: ABC transporter permease subunit [Oligoflexales bacterium]|nr:ABC transporter permease subunit [Oligoflexales bacterium]